MNFMRKVLGGSGSGGPPGQGDKAGGQGAGSAGGYQPQQELLGLNHLKKLYSEYSNPSQPLSSAEKEAKLYAMLPLFCKEICQKS